jgi:hypothetical protein
MTEATRNPKPRRPREKQASTALAPVTASIETPSEPDFETVSEPTPPSQPTTAAALRDRLSEVDGQIVALEAQIAGLIEKLADPAEAAATERTLAGTEGLLRHRRGERVGLAQRLAAAEATERAEAQRPQRERLNELANETLQERVTEFRAALEAVLATGQAVATVLHEIGEMAVAAGHQRAVELQHASPEAMGAGSPARLALPLVVYGVGYRLAPAHHAGDRLMGLDALSRLTADVQAIIANEGGKV